MQNLRYGKEIKIHFISIHVLVCLPIYDVNISLFRPIQLGFSLLPSPNPSPTQLPPGSQVIGDGQIFVIRVKIVLKKMGGEKSRTCVQGSCSLFRLNLSLFYYYFFFHLNLFYMRRQWKVVTTNPFISKVLKYVTVSVAIISYFEFGLPRLLIGWFSF